MKFGTVIRYRHVTFMIVAQNASGVPVDTTEGVPVPPGDWIGLTLENGPFFDHYWPVGGTAFCTSESLEGTVIDE